MTPLFFENPYPVNHAVTFNIVFTNTVTGPTFESQSCDSSLIVQGLFVPFACVGSGDPVRVLRLLHNKYAGYN